MENWLMIVTAAAFLIGLVAGFAKGAIKIAVSLLATIVTFVLVFFATPYVSKGITTATPLQDVIETKIESMIVGMVTDEESPAQVGSEEQIRKALEAAGMDEAKLAEYDITVQDIAEGRVSADDLAAMGISRNLLAGMGQQTEVTTDDLETAEIPRDMQIAAIEGADIPSIFKSLLLTNNNSEIYEKLGVTGFVPYVATYLAKLIINVAAFLLTFVVVSIVLRAIVFSLNVVAELPVLGLVNRLAGGVLGLMLVLLFVWTAFLIITMLYTTGIGKSLFEMIQESEFLTAIYEYNPVLKLATSMRL